MKEVNWKNALPFGSRIRQTIEDIKKITKDMKEVNWKKALPFGSHIRETIEDIRIIKGK